MHWSELFYPIICQLSHEYNNTFIQKNQINQSKVVFVGYGVLVVDIFVYGEYNWYWIKQISRSDFYEMQKSVGFGILFAFDIFFKCL